MPIPGLPILDFHGPSPFFLGGRATSLYLPRAPRIESWVEKHGPLNLLRRQKIEVRVLGVRINSEFCTGIRQEANVGRKADDVILPDNGYVPRASGVLGTWLVEGNDGLLDDMKIHAMCPITGKILATGQSEVERATAGRNTCRCCFLVFD